MKEKTIIIASIRTQLAKVISIWIKTESRFQKDLMRHIYSRPRSLSNSSRSKPSNLRIPSPIKAAGA
jgi:hypothetical protein